MMSRTLAAMATLAAMVVTMAMARGQGAAAAGEKVAAVKPFEEYFADDVFDYIAYNQDITATHKAEPAKHREANERAYRDARVPALMRATHLVSASYMTFKLTQDADAALKYLDANMPDGGLGEARADAFVTSGRAGHYMRDRRFAEALPLLRDAFQKTTGDYYKRGTLQKLIECYEGLGRSEDVLNAALDALILYPAGITPATAMKIYGTVQRIGARTMEPEEFWRIRLKIAGGYPPAGQDVGVWRQFVETLGVNQ
jgi:hypothetical protein